MKKTQIQFSITQEHLDRAIAARNAHVAKPTPHWDNTQHCVLAQAATDALPKGGVVEAGLENASRYAENPNTDMLRDRRIGLTHWLDFTGETARKVRAIVRLFDQEQFEQVKLRLPLTVTGTLTDYELETKENA